MTEGDWWEYLLACISTMVMCIGYVQWMGSTTTVLVFIFMNKSQHLSHCVKYIMPLYTSFSHILSQIAWTLHHDGNMEFHNLKVTSTILYCNLVILMPFKYVNGNCAEIIKLDTIFIMCHCYVLLSLDI
jgi:hypothetical protein